MSWFTDWFSSWFDSWFGDVQQSQPGVTTSRRFGRYIQSGDILFGDADYPCAVTSGGVVLVRQGIDDYVRFKLPDTNCPPLPEPNTPLDDGQADVAEPNRWAYGGQYVSTTGWRFGATQGNALDWVKPNYTCYGGDFTVELTLSWSDAGLPRLPNASQSADFDLFIFGIEQGNGYGICLGSFGGQSMGQPWQMGVFAFVNGAVGTQLGWLTAGDTAHFRIMRSGSTVSVRYVENNQSATVITGSSGQVQLKLWRDFTLPDPETGKHIPVVTTTSIATISGAPASVTVATPVVDMGKSIQCTVQRLPENIGTLEWRASDTAFAPDASSPAWSNPTGEYRYWQARVTWSSIQQLLERIEFSVPFVVPEQQTALYLRFRLFRFRTSKIPADELSRAHWLDKSTLNEEGEPDESKLATILTYFKNALRRKD